MAISDITIIVSAGAAGLTAIGAISQNIYTQYSKNKQQRFENYHNLIEKINTPKNGSEDIYIQVQSAALFELRNYKEYRDISKQILLFWSKKDDYADVATETLRKLGYK